MSASIAAAARTTPCTREQLGEAVRVIWGMKLPQIGHEQAKEWFDLSVRHPEGCWYTLGSTRSYGELVEIMGRVAPLLPEGVFITASRCYGWDDYECSYESQTFLLSQTGRHLRLQNRYD
jgi:hypothetical protein